MKDALRFVLVNKLSPMEAVRATKFCVTRQALHKELRKLQSPAHVGAIVTAKEIDVSSLSSYVRSPSTTATSPGEKRKIGERSASPSVTVVTNENDNTDVEVLRSVRLNTSQTQKLNLLKKVKGETEADVYARAMKEACSRLKIASDLREDAKEGEGLRGICADVNEKYLKNHPRKISRSSVQRYSKRNGTNFHPKKRGPQSKVPEALLNAMKCETSMMQVSGQGEAKPRDIIGTISTALVGTRHEHISPDYVYRKLRRERPEAMQKSRMRNCEDIRLQWTTREKLDQWFTDSKVVLIDLKFGEDRITINDDGTIDELYIPKNKLARICSFDETDHPLTNKGDESGPRAGSYTNPDLPRPGGAATRGSRHTTGCYGTVANGESLPPLYIFDSKAFHEDNYKVKPDWCKNLPYVVGKWGLDYEKSINSFVGVSKTGSMTIEIFQQYIENCIVTLFPNVFPTWEYGPQGEVIKGPILIKTDMGPGRLVAEEININWRDELREKGVHLIGSPPNATSVSAEMDQLFSDYKGRCRRSTQRCYNKKLHARMIMVRKRRENPTLKIPTKALALSLEDIPFITNGMPHDPKDKSPFKSTFTKEKIIKSWENVGFVPFTRKCLQSVQVRQEINESNPQDSKLEQLQLDYELAKSNAKACGLNEDAFNLEIPIAKAIERKETSEDQVQELLKNKAAFKAGGLFLHTKNMLFNSKTIIEAERRTLKAVQDKKDHQVHKKTAEQVKIQTEACEAYARIKNDPTYKVLAPDFRAILRHVLVVMKDPSVISSYKNNQMVQEKLLTIPWKDMMDAILAAHSLQIQENQPEEDQNNDNSLVIKSAEEGEQDEELCTDDNNVDL